MERPSRASQHGTYMNNEFKQHYHITLGTCAHRSATMDLELDRVLHLAVPAFIEVLTAFRWDAVIMPATILDEILLWASRNVTAETLWCDLHGPASVVATLLRLGLTLTNPQLGYQGCLSIFRE